MTVRSPEGLEGLVIVNEYKGRGRVAAASEPRQRDGFFYRLFMRWFGGSRRMRL